MVNYGEKYISVSPIKSVLVLLLIAAFGFSANAKHITGGEMIYDYIGRGTAAGQWRRHGFTANQRCDAAHRRAGHPGRPR